MYAIKHFVSLSKVCMLQATVHRGNLATVHYNGVGVVDARHSVYCRGVCVHYKGIFVLEVTALTKQFLTTVHYKAVCVVLTTLPKGQVSCSTL